jgi:hypothetical protein
MGKGPMRDALGRTRGWALFIFWLALVLKGCMVTAESEKAGISQSDTTRGALYKLGGQAARTDKRFFADSFATGIAVGMAMPFVSGGSAAFLYQSTGDHKSVGIAAGITAATLWTWGGHTFISRRAVTVPERHHSALDAREQKEFDAGYTDIAGKKRNSQFTVGTIIGFWIPVGVSWYILSQIDWSGD